MIVRARDKAMLAEHERARALTHDLAHLVSFAFHEPKKIPEYKPLAPARAARREVSTPAEDAAVRAWFITAALRTKH